MLKKTIIIIIVVEGIKINTRNKNKKNAYKGIKMHHKKSLRKMIRKY